MLADLRKLRESFHPLSPRANFRDIYCVVLFFKYEILWCEYPYFLPSMVKYETFSPGVLNTFPSSGYCRKLRRDRMKIYWKWSRVYLAFSFLPPFDNIPVT